MAIRVKLDLINGCRVESNCQGERIFRVAEVSGLGSLPAPQRSIAALTAIDSVDGSIMIPRIGNAHPYEPAAVCRYRTFTAASHDIYNVLCIYEWLSFPASYLKTFHAALQTATRHYDNARNKAIINYTPRGSSDNKKMVASLNLLLPSVTLTATRLETANPETLTTMYAGTVNATPWRGYPPRTWMMLPVVGQTEDNAWYRNSYSWVYNPQTHDEYAFFMHNGQVPQDVADTLVTNGTAYSGNGWGRFRVAPEISYGSAFGWIL